MYPFLNQHTQQPMPCRVSLAFEQALMVLFHYPDVWLEFARWHQHGGGGGAAAALAVLEKGRGALPSALALHFAAADLQVCLLFYFMEGGFWCHVDQQELAGWRLAGWLYGPEAVWHDGSGARASACWCWKAAGALDAKR